MADGLPSSAFVPLSAALSWIAFGDWTNSCTHWNDYTHAKKSLEEALALFLDKAIEGVILVRGKLIKNPDADPVESDTDNIPAVRFHDFRQYDQTCCGLRAGAGLYGFAEEGENSFDNVYQPLGRQDFYRDVIVRREEVEREFPAATVGLKVTHAEVVQWCRDWLEDGKGTDGNKAWSVFVKMPRFKGCSRDDFFRPAWTEAKTNQNQ